ncbi:MAG: YcfL family protein [Chromatiaceae bacterium]|nr:YcfL family protein [Gammaproteobacteria bacterium]MCP5300840.1 YcfL family protein [Chromatiaceae bacterium]MCP5421687.1 YcfL family protein [Chromatiaceae bacterium]
MRITIAAALFAALGSAGCQTTGVSDPDIRHYQQDTVNASNPRARLVLGSQKLVGEIALVDARLGSAGELAKGEVTVQNLSDNRYTLEYQYAWEDKDGFSIGENRVWQRFVLGPRALQSFRSVASDPRAYGFTMTVRLPDDLFIHQEQFLDRK